MEAGRIANEQGQVDHEECHAHLKSTGYQEVLCHELESQIRGKRHLSEEQDLP